MALTAEEKEVVDLLKTDEGTDFEVIYSSVKSIADKQELVRLVRHLTHLGLIYKRDGGYYRVDLDPDDEDKAGYEEPEPEPQAASKPPIVIDDDEEDEDPGQVAVAKPPLVSRRPEVHLSHAEVVKEMKGFKRPCGNLRRTGASGAVAMALWLYRNEGYALPMTRLRQCAGPAHSAGSIYQAAAQLARADVIERTGEGLYKWGSRFAYPFASVEDDDAKLVYVLPKSMRTVADQMALHTAGSSAQAAEAEEEPVDQPAAEPVVKVAGTPAPKQNAADTAIALAAIDEAIRMFENKIEGLQLAKALLQAA